MNDKRYQWILYVIVFVILGTIAIQVYWNYKNYEANKTQLINDVQISLDNAVDAYYTNLAEKSTLGFTVESSSSADLFSENGKFDSLIKAFEFSNKGITSSDSIDIHAIDGVNIFRGIKADSMMQAIKMPYNNHKSNRAKILIKDSTTSEVERFDFKLLTSKVVISINNDSLKLEDIDSLLQPELQRKQLSIDYSLSFKTPLDTFQFAAKNSVDKSVLTTLSKSPFLPKGSILTIHFSNETKIILKRILSGILISTLLVLAVISCLFYLLKIIKHQKQLAEVKNDLISNITHEFKTPIATISVALESIKSFNVIEDKEKTKSYLKMSNTQLSKLNVMVEKLLETATLDSDHLILNKEPVNIAAFLTAIIDKHQIQIETKTINFTTSDDEIIANVDVFHFENALNNIIDNAIKYGGEIISVNLTTHKNAFEIAVSDNGNTITKANKDKIFEKFYRITKGNTHDVKGFGIGLYYTKKIIEKHLGTILLDLNKKQTTFKISLPNE
jgi:signal transduction histidine kinase